ncbi:DNA adenine methylase [Mycolicibacterium fortuitum]|uniref:DNA adenine methylase n=1 Tax=Mycolicibacterium fortuitum TaxID=1766 RepID=A0AAE4VCR2_MYCFO|nr:DNA adenine methylase [Mycolicibacterium fortuitum]MDV7193359.1 DNA adenine methylase [Mycolicibacterium fortuitum]MDV7205960.1 DNA adenine methylase [Mycolicibacterium fortuitum]MDV7227373.1 DNA adenine methylase [Mycolicibacterium fortuitum]MDV7259930.1 DNA adenine methylase [Mycolicibacterium fortuitum]MDV7287566.1 DNA adenine methylase [Mycolicibacterium fortuitum]
MTAPPMAYYGGKTRLAAKIAGLLPPHAHYIEPFAGGLSVLLAKQPSRMETVSDLDGHLMAFWKVLRDKPAELARACALTPHSREEYLAAKESLLDDLDDVERARLIWVKLSQGRGGTLQNTAWRHYVDPAGSSVGMPQYLNGYVDRMAACAERLHHVSLESRPALDIIKQYGKVSTCCLYVDPPYLGSSRTRGGGTYRHEMRGHDEHLELLWELMGCQAAVVVSGYPSALYDDALAGWDRVAIETMTGQAKSSNKARTEVLWSNREISDQRSLFDLEAGA